MAPIPDPSAPAELDGGPLVEVKVKVKGGVDVEVHVTVNVSNAP